ncbi:MAG: hypothetical protein P1V18_00130 [Candidatus Gracilibacteria bacterium]|nr:hypothetical protein [Candidatus Gracilibacteria bacterium]
MEKNGKHVLDNDPLKIHETRGEDLYRLLNQQRRIFKRISYVLYELINNLNVGLVFSKEDLENQLSKEPIDPLRNEFTLQLLPKTTQFNILDSSTFRRFHHSKEALGGSVSIDGMASSTSINLCIDFTDSSSHLLFGATPTFQKDLGTGYHTVKVHQTDSQKIRIIVDEDDMQKSQSPAKILEECRSRYVSILDELTLVMFDAISPEIHTIKITKQMVRNAIVKTMEPPFSMAQKFFLGDFTFQKEGTSRHDYTSEALQKGLSLGEFCLSSKGWISNINEKTSHNLILSLEYNAASPKTPIKTKQLTKKDFG